MTKILAIETSCDETAAAIVEDGVKILSSALASSAQLHVQSGGIIPENAARLQVLSMIPVLEKTMQSFSKDDIDAIAVTVGPGLIGSLLVGVETARTLSFIWKKPLISVNHLVAHIYANFVNEISNNKLPLPSFPALALVVSGGHTDLVLMTNQEKIKWIGGTRDDAAGEAFDKAARLLGLPYPGGPSISKAAEEYKLLNPENKNTKLQMFPRPMINDNSFDWSFSGLKTAILRKTEELRDKDTQNLSQDQVFQLAANVQEAIVDVLVKKTLRAVKKYKVKTLFLAGGVAANKRLRDKFESEIKTLKLEIDFLVPLTKLCTDNAVSIASYAYFNNKPSDWKKIDARPELTIMDQV